MKELLTYLGDYFSYHKDGTLTRTDRINSNGSYDKDGYLILKIKGKQYKAHRIVWAFHNNEMPNGEIDHINRNRSDNRIENLRVVDRQGNIDNTTRYANKDTGFYGIHLDKSTKGLKAIYTTRYKNKTHRFRILSDAVKFRTNKGLSV